MKRLLAMTMIISLFLGGCQSRTVSHTCKFSDDDSGSGYQTNTNITMVGDRETDSIDTVTVDIIMDTTSDEITDDAKELMKQFFAEVDNQDGVTSTITDTADSYTVRTVFDMAKARDALEYLYLDFLITASMTEAVTEFEDEGFTCN